MTDADDPVDDASAGSSGPGDFDQNAGTENVGGRDVEKDAQPLPPWKNPAYRFVFLFLVYLGAIAYGYPKFRERYVWVLDAMAVWTAKIEYHLFSCFDLRVTTSKKIVAYNGFAIRIIEECTGVYEILIFAAAVLAFPTTWSKKVAGLGMGVPILYAFNVIRIAVLMLVGKHYPQHFDFMHLYFWQATLILMITSVWLLWITQVVNRDWSRSASDS